MSDALENPDVRHSYRDEMVEDLRQSGLLKVGRLTLLMPRSFGFCWGVDRALAMVESARHQYPGRRMWLLSSLIHNPRVNEDMRKMGIGFLKGPNAVEGAYEQLTEDDVVIIPAFSAEVEDMELLKQCGVAIVDTTCPWVIKPHKRTLRYLKEGFTTVIHGTVGHDETRATCSLVNHEGGRFLVVHDIDEAAALADYLLGKIDGPELQKVLHPMAIPEDFDCQRDLRKIGIINQTTMLASESRAIGDLLKAALMERDGEDGIAESFRDFDTICRATQDNQDAANTVVKEHPDLFIVVGGYDSSNTRNLARVGDYYDVPSFHIEGPDCIAASLSYRERPSGEILQAENWLPSEGPVRVAFTAGASTPDTILGQVINRLVAYSGENWA
ncbi:MAG: 4-hydroxy-3-methylbut-2-enyl diphosphate reductase [Planctomycetes bacterium]|nr:4-hydroxy-3-methylbut-2-enyl diphosphate reductase [Planctomycetota bacterium]